MSGSHTTGLRTRAEVEAMAAHAAERERDREARRAAQVFAAAIPAALIVAIVLGLIVLALGGCAERAAQGYTMRDEIRASCASAAHAYTLAVERTRAGTMSAQTFAQVSAGYDGVVATCRRLLLSDVEPVPADQARVDAWTARTEAEAR